MDSPRVKDSGRKLVPRSVVHVETVREESRAKVSRDLKVGIWNVRSLFRAGAYEELMREIDRYDLDITAIQESRWPGQGEISGCKHVFFFYYFRK